MKKIKYAIYSEGTKPSKTPLVYSFGNTKNIEMTVTKKGFAIEVFRSVVKTHEDILNDSLFIDAIKKACLIKIIKYGEIKYNTIYITIGDETKEIAVESKDKNPIVFGLCGNKLERPFAKNWGVSQLDEILNTPKSKEGRLHAALYALIMAKSKKYESEKFVYLWMAMNGLYGHIAEIAKPCLKGDKEQKWIKNEFAQIKFLSMFYEIKYNGFAKDDREGAKLLFEIEKELDSQFCSSIKPVIKDGKINFALITKIEDVLKRCRQTKHMSPEGALLFFVPYKIRCKQFHSEKTLPLFCLKDEYPLPMISILNAILEDFLEKNIPIWMDSKEKIKLEERVEEIAKCCICNRDGYLMSYVVDSREL